MQTDRLRFDFLPVKNYNRFVRRKFVRLGITLVFVLIAGVLRYNLNVSTTFITWEREMTYLKKSGTQIMEKYENDDFLCYRGMARFYGSFDVVNCLDGYRERNQKNTTHSNIALRFAFIGDSRTRHQFISFVNLIPDYDMERTYQNASTKHNDRNVTSSLHNIFLSFYWRPMLGQDLFQTIEKLVVDGESTPDFVLIGLTIWNLVHQPDFQNFREGIMKLKLLLSSLAQKTIVIWLKQYPTVELFGAINDVNTAVHNQKIFQFNERVEEIFSNTKIKIWGGSGYKAVEEYIRSCLLNKSRQEKDAPGTAYGPAYFRCLDFCHPGSAAIYQHTQEIYNYFCNTCAV